MNTTELASGLLGKAQLGGNDWWPHAAFDGLLTLRCQVLQRVLVELKRSLCGGFGFRCPAGCLRHDSDSPWFSAGGLAFHNIYTTLGRVLRQLLHWQAALDCLASLVRRRQILHRWFLGRPVVALGGAVFFGSFVLPMIRISFVLCLVGVCSQLRRPGNGGSGSGVGFKAGSAQGRTDARGVGAKRPCKRRTNERTVQPSDRSRCGLRGAPPCLRVTPLTERAGRQPILLFGRSHQVPIRRLRLGAGTRSCLLVSRHQVPGVRAQCKGPRTRCGARRGDWIGQRRWCSRFRGRRRSRGFGRRRRGLKGEESTFHPTHALQKDRIVERHFHPPLADFTNSDDRSTRERSQRRSRRVR